jgi:hypothetical protein
MNRKQRRICHQCVFTLTAIAVFMPPAWAQQANIRSVTFYRVKPDRLGDMQAAAKEYKAILQKAGSNRYYTDWLSLTGPNEYLHVVNYSKWADIDMTVAQDPKLKEQAADLQRIVTRIIQCTESSHRVIEEVLPDSSLPPSKELPDLIRAVRLRVRPDKVNDFLALSKSEILPAQKKSGVKVYSIARVRYGAPSSEFLTVLGLSKWADLDEPYGVQKAMGEEGYQRFLSKITPLLLESEYNMYRLQRDLSYLPPPSGSGAGN